MRFTEVIDDGKTATLVDEAGKVRLRIFLLTTPVIGEAIGESPEVDSLVGTRGRDADERVKLLAHLATCHNDLTEWNREEGADKKDIHVPIRRTWGTPSYDLGERCVCGETYAMHHDPFSLAILCDGFQSVQDPACENALPDCGPADRRTNDDIWLCERCYAGLASECPSCGEPGLPAEVAPCL